MRHYCRRRLPGCIDCRATSHLRDDLDQAGPKIRSHNTRMVCSPSAALRSRCLSGRGSRVSVPAPSVAVHGINVSPETIASADGKATNAGLKVAF